MESDLNAVTDRLLHTIASYYTACSRALAGI